tara:strand:+ start:4621 stop:5388 length:768 start_codon:yes stop_codon:yes gene_type:complete
LDYHKELEIAITAAVSAGQKIMDVYEDSNKIDFESKSDNSPLTIADKKSHNTIVEYLNRTNINIISEESSIPTFDKRKDWNEYWLIDPLDGTKEFIKRNGEFTVNIALIKNNTPHIGVVFCPVKKILYWNNSRMDVFKKENEEEIKLNQRKSILESDDNLRVVVSRSHMNDETKKYIDKLKNPQLISCGSSLKFLYIADNKADVYPRFGPTMEWDTAAAHAILNALNIQVINIETGREVEYNKENLLNPHFIIRA